MIPIDPGVWPVSCGWPVVDAGQLDERAAYTVPNATNRPLPWISWGQSMMYVDSIVGVYLQNKRHFAADGPIEGVWVYDVVDSIGV